MKAVPGSHDGGSGTSLRVKTLLVTGAAGALGGETAVHFARLGVKVAAACHTKSEAERAKEYFAAQKAEGVRTYAADLGSEEQVKALLAAAGKDLGGIEGLIHCAGGFRWGRTWEMSVADYEFLIVANLKSSWLVAKHLVPSLIEKGHGRLIFISSKAALASGEVGFGLYAAAKAGLNQFVQCLAAELKDSGLHVNAILPSIIDTPQNRRDMPKADWRSWVSPRQLTAMMEGLMSAAGDGVHGALIPVTGRL